MAVLASLPIGLIRPYYGILVYAWISYMYPHLLGWSFIRTWPVAKIAGIGALLGTILHREGDTRPLLERENILMILLFGMFTLSSCFAFHPDLAWRSWQDMAKMILIALVTSTMLTDRERFRYFFLVIALSLGFYGAKGGLFGIRTRGENMVVGPDPSIISANNALGVALNMTLPILWYLAKDIQQKWLQRGLQLAFLLTILAIMFTYSRASALGLGAVLLAIILKGKRRVQVLSLLLVFGTLTYGFLPEKWVKRQQTTLTYEEDRSAMSRLGEWEFCWRLALDRPLTGGGFRFYSMETFAKYLPEFLETYGTFWNSHSIYFGVLAAHGFPGLFIYLLMIGCCMLSLWRIKRAVREREDLAWLANYCDIVQVSYLGFLVNGAFNNMEYFDLVYHWVAVVASLKVLSRKVLAGSLNEAASLAGQSVRWPTVASHPLSYPARVR